MDAFHWLIGFFCSQWNGGMWPIHAMPHDTLAVCKILIRVKQASKGFEPTTSFPQIKYRTNRPTMVLIKYDVETLIYSY